MSAAIWIVGILQHVYIVVDDGYTINNIVALVYLLIDGYILWVVLAFIHEMEFRSDCTDDEIQYTREIRNVIWTDIRCAEKDGSLMYYFEPNFDVNVPCAY